MKKNYTDQEYMYFVLLNRIIEFILSYASQDSSSANFLADMRNNNVDPFFLQTEKGIVLKIDFQNKYPLSLSSIFGEWQCFGIGKNYKEWKRIMPLIIKKLGAKKLNIKSNRFAFYSINEVDNLPIPETMFLSRNEFLSNGQVIKRWTSLKKIYTRRSKGATTQRNKKR